MAGDQCLLSPEESSSLNSWGPDPHLADIFLAGKQICFFLSSKIPKSACFF